MAGAALLIGNAAYRGAFSSLRTPVDDVVHLGDRLVELGFETYVEKNLDRAQMGSVIQQFAAVVERLPDDGNVFVYFSGHGIQRGGESYLVPIDAQGADVAAMTLSFFRLSDVMQALCLRPDQHKWLVMDACRSNHLPGFVRSGAAGMAGESPHRYEGVRNTVILYAAEPGQVAYDTADKGASPVCRGLLAAFRLPERGIKEMTTDITDFVCTDTGEAQVPWEVGTVRRSRPFFGSKSRPLPMMETTAVAEGDRYVSERGHLVHKLLAKDATGEWAYYFVLVEPEQEAAFLRAIDGEGTINLAAYGSVIASCYGREPTSEVLDYLFKRYGFRLNAN